MQVSPYPTHGFFLVGIIVFIYISIVLILTFGLTEIGLPEELAVYAFIIIAVTLLKPFWPLFRQLTPTREKTE